MADPTSDDPVARESTRLTAVAVSGAQTTLDPKQMKEWTPNSHYGAHAFGIRFLHRRVIDGPVDSRDFLNRENHFYRGFRSILRMHLLQRMTRLCT